MNPIFIALSFLTIIPFKTIEIQNHDFKSSLKFFPLVGLMLGFILYFMTFLPFNSGILSLFIVLVWVVITGGFHLDGVADVFDAIGSLQDREKAFEIMKDSRIGAIGVIALILVILAKFVFIKNIILIAPLYIILSPVAGRFAINFLSWRLNYAKEKGLGKSIVEFTDNTTFIFSLIFTGIAFGIVDLKLIFLFIDLLFFLYFCSVFFERKFNGITGDILGCMVELSELFILFGGLFFVNR